jgi:hypothetical protein
MNTLALSKRLFFIPVLAFLMAAGNASQAQGRVIINEFMAWPGEACPVTAEFIELKNMGPGPMNIGCYVITDGDFSITIPANTILQPGEFYVLGGQNTIDAPCANLSRSINVNLNWNTCGCTNAPIPTTGEGFMTDGGSASEQLVMFNAAGNVIDAVVRKLTGIETSVSITTSSAGGCGSFTFDLDDLNITYEEIGESQGRGNSFARFTDGDCKWVKETQQNGGATNNATGEAATLSMSMLTTLNLNCITGNAVFTVNNASPSTYFPMTYTLGYDANGNGQFNAQDIYTSGSDNTSPSIEFYNLSLGTYNIVIEPANGCNTQFFNFELGPCATMDIKLKSFTGNNLGKMNRFNIEVETDNDMKLLQLESSLDGIHFMQPLSIPFEKRKGSQSIQYNVESNAAQFFRLAMTDLNGKKQFSKVINLVKTMDNNEIKIAPNPFTDYVGLSEYSNREDILQVNIISTSGQIMASERFNLRSGQNNFRIQTYKIPKGIYMMQMKKQLSGETQIARIIKN